ncbi:MAG: hypothetical protein IT538_09400 [Variibacter sp.]|nr:hypothetical protein [Variibacter sp.]
MAVLAVYRYAVKPGRMADFVAKLGEAASPKFQSRIMPNAVRLLRSTVPGPDSGLVVMIEYNDMAAYGMRMAYEHSNTFWRALWEPTPDSPETLLSVELLTELPT